MEKGSATERPPRRPRKATLERREQIIRAATKTFAAKGYRNGSLMDIAEQVGMTHAGVLHHFGTKEQLLVGVLAYRDEEDLEVLADQQMPHGMDLFRHFMRTVRANTQREGLVQSYVVVTGESVTESHPARGWVTDRFTTLRGHITDALDEVCGPDLPPEVRSQAATAVIAVMDGTQTQWLLDKDAVDLLETSRFAIEAILVAAQAGADRARPLADC